MRYAFAPQYELGKSQAAARGWVNQAGVNDEEVDDLAE